MELFDQSAGLVSRALADGRKSPCFRYDAGAKESKNKSKRARRMDPVGDAS